MTTIFFVLFTECQYKKKIFFMDFPVSYMKLITEYPSGQLLILFGV